MRPSSSPSRRGLRALVAATVAGVLGASLALAAAAPASGDAIDDRRAAAERQKKENARKRADAQEAMEGISSALAVTSDRLLEIEEQLPDARLALDEANAAYAKSKRQAKLIADQLQDATEQADVLAAAIEQDSGQADKMRQAIGQMAREAYRGGGDASSVSLILDADSSQDFIERADLVGMALRTRAQVLDDLQASEADNRSSQQRLTAVHGRIGELKAAADAKVVETDRAKDKAAAAKASLDKLLSEQKSKQASLEDQKAAVLAEIRAADAEAAKIAAALKAAILEQQKRDAAKGGGKPGKITGRLFVNPTATNPIYVTSEYGNRFHPVLHYWRLHAGIDLRDRCGQAVYAGRAGTVMWTQYRSGYGNQVMINHGMVNGNGLASSYNHLSAFVVKPGQSVKAGQLIARAGNTGTSAACHLHFEVYINGSTVNPRPYLPI